MTVPSEFDVVVATPATDDTGSYVDWAAIIAGIVIASAISLVLLTFGSAIGLSFTNFRAGPDVAPIWIAIAAASWLLWVQISSFMAGGYVAGRLRKRHNDATEHEVDVRDGAHGLLVWGGALVVGAIIAIGGIGSAVNAIGNVAGTVTTAASNVAGGAAEGAVDSVDPNAYFTDLLFRAAPTSTAEDPAATATPAATDAAPAATGTDATAATAPTATAAAPAAPATTSAPAMDMAMAEPAAPVDTSAARAEAGRIFAQGAIDGALSDSDKSYLAQSVAANTGMTQAEATARVDEVVAAMDAAKAKAAAAAEEARKAAVLAAFLVAASLLVSAVGAFWAAQKGGNHRDEGTAFPDMFRRV